MRGEGRGEERRGTSTGYKGGERKEGQGKGKRREGRIEAGRKGGRKETSLSPIHRVLDIYVYPAERWVWAAFKGQGGTQLDVGFTRKACSQLFFSHWLPRTVLERIGHLIFVEGCLEGNKATAKVSRGWASRVMDKKHL